MLYLHLFQHLFHIDGICLNYIVQTYFHFLLLFDNNKKLFLNLFLYLYHFHKNIQVDFVHHYTLVQLIFYTIQMLYLHLFQRHFRIDNIFLNYNVQPYLHFLLPYDTNKLLFLNILVDFHTNKLVFLVYFHKNIQVYFVNH
jgi:hypothetical protein